MKVAIVGSRTIPETESIKKVLDEYDITSIKTGDATDSMAVKYAHERNIRPDWKKYGRSAGIRRNGDIVSGVCIVMLGCHAVTIANKKIE